MVYYRFSKGFSVSRYCEWFQKSGVALQELKLCSFPKIRMYTGTLEGGIIYSMCIGTPF